MILAVCLWILVFFQHVRNQWGGKFTFGRGQARPWKRTWPTSPRNSSRTSRFPYLWTCFGDHESSFKTDFDAMRLSKAWCNCDIRRLSGRKKRAFKQVCAIKKQADWYSNKKFQKEAQQACRSVHYDNMNNMISELGSNNKKLAYIKDMKCDSSGIVAQ